MPWAQFDMRADSAAKAFAVAPRALAAWLGTVLLVAGAVSTKASTQPTEMNSKAPTAAPALETANAGSTSNHPTTPDAKAESELFTNVSCRPRPTRAPPPRTCRHGSRGH